MPSRSRPVISAEARALARKHICLRTSNNSPSHLEIVSPDGQSVIGLGDIPPASQLAKSGLTEETYLELRHDYLAAVIQAGIDAERLRTRLKLEDRKRAASIELHRIHRETERLHDERHRYEAEQHQVDALLSFLDSSEPPHRDLGLDHASQTAPASRHATSAGAGVSVAG